MSRYKEVKQIEYMELMKFYGYNQGLVIGGIMGYVKAFKDELEIELDSDEIAMLKEHAEKEFMLYFVMVTICPDTDIKSINDNREEFFTKHLLHPLNDIIMKAFKDCWIYNFNSDDKEWWDEYEKRLLAKLRDLQNKIAEKGVSNET